MTSKDRFVEKQKSNLDIIEIVNCLHFDDKAFIENEKIEHIEGQDFFYYYDLFLSKNNTDFRILGDHEEFNNRLEILFADEELKVKITEHLEENPEKFKEFYNAFSDFRNKLDTNLKTTEEVDKCISAIKERGVYKFERMFTEEQLEKLIKFQKSVTDLMKNQNVRLGAGYISVTPQAGLNIGLAVRHEKHDYGLMRMQSKSMGFFHPGSDIIINDNRLNQIYQSWYKNKNAKISRGTMDWLVPADINHNGWHIDILSNQLKAMVLLSDVDLTNGPTYYANGSHYISNDFELKMKHATFVHGLSKKHCLGTRHGNNICAIEGGNVTYVSDDFVNNQPTKLDYDDITIDNQSYNKTVATGKRGDVIFFDSCGYHSGNICQEGMRLDLVLSCPTESSYIGNFLKALGKNL